MIKWFPKASLWFQLNKLPVRRGHFALKGSFAMQWSDEGIIISTRRHGESSVVVELLTREHGRHAGLVRGGRGRRLRPVLQIGNRVLAVWKARLAEHLGLYALEPVKLRAALVMGEPLKLMALQSVCALAGYVAEREPHPQLYEATELFISALVEEGEAWCPQMVFWELGLLAELGYGLDLSSCAVTGGRQGLTHVSPRTGRAVCAQVAEPYKGKLLPLPAFLVEEEGEIAKRDIGEGLRLCRYFLEKKHVVSQRLASCCLL